ncbi:MAG: YceI family protein [Phycisphaerales bacterium]|nr:YceI family protein [Phycisphaerales bacterium]
MIRTGFLVTIALVTLALLSGGRATAVGSSAVFNVDPAHSTMNFKVRHFGVSNFYGRINNPTGRFDLAAGVLDITLDMSKIDAGNDSRDRYLKGPDMFSVRDHPEASFKATSISKVDDTTWKAEGEFTMRGVSKTIGVTIEGYTEATLERFGHRAGFECVFTIDRGEFDVSHHLDDGTLGREVTIIAAIEGVQG